MIIKILIGAAILAGAYLIICGIIGGLRFAHVAKQNSYSQNLPYGEERYNALKSRGAVTDYQVYTDDEIAQNPALSTVKLYYFPCDKAEPTEYMLICPGGAYAFCCTPGEGFSIAAAANDAGHTAFVLEYRTGANGGNRAPLADLAAAVKLITERAVEWNVKATNYSVCGFSAGGNLIGLYGTDNWGYKNYAGLTKPAALIMGYPWSNLNAKGRGNAVATLAYLIGNSLCYKYFLGKGATVKMKLNMRVPPQITADYPPTYIMHGTADVMVPIKTHSDILAKSLELKGVPHRYKRCKGVTHGCGLGVKTSADGWFSEAVDFWEEQIR